MARWRQHDVARCLVSWHEQAVRMIHRRRVLKKAAQRIALASCAAAVDGWVAWAATMRQRRAAAKRVVSRLQRGAQARAFGR